MSEPAPDIPWHTAPDLPENSHGESEAHTPLHGCWLVFVRMVWIGLVLLAAATFVAAIPARITQLSTVAPDARLSLLRFRVPDAEDVAVLLELGLSIRFYAGYIIICEVVPVVAFAIVAALLASWKSKD